jgi:hypothetical protein
MSGCFRKSLLEHRQALMVVWPLAFPRHSFSDPRLIRSHAEPIVPWPNEADWAASARNYHRERREKERCS